ncbi:transcriptional regulator [Streptomyces sp. P38-E01]|uniref:Transcriptional regulator n=1 Tax=Streptomyces tardus TaxID=2780544 RepID=A0A949JML5_9ACTN|nr:transcriptional regulator [Streptomyces tardus]MBU7598944.1 transcriptional regulator [Streptomyces tardus]
MVTPDGVGQLLRTIREKAGRSRIEQAERLAAAGRHCTEENVKRWELEMRLPSPVWYPAISSVYELGEEQVRAAVAASRWHRKQKKESEDVERRKFLGGAAATAGIVALPGIAQAREHIDSALTPTGEADIAYFEGVFERHRGGYAGRTPDAVLGVMEQDLQELSAALRRTRRAGERGDLVRAAAGITGLVAIIQHDRGDRADSHRWFTIAEKVAREAADRRTLSWVLARRAMVPLNYGAPRQAAEYAHAARRAAGRTPTGAAALASAVHARALAALNDVDGARKAIASTESLLQKIDGDETADTWFGYPGQKHHVHLSQAYTLLGDTKAAYHNQDAAIALTRSPSVMTRALLALDTATCLQIDGDHREAANMAAEAWDRLPVEHRSGLVRARATALLDRLDETAQAHLRIALTP